MRQLITVILLMVWGRYRQVPSMSTDSLPKDPGIKFILTAGMIGYMVESSAAIAEGLAKSDSHKYDKYRDGSIPGAIANTPQISPVWDLLAVIGAGLIDFGLLNVIAGTPIRIVNNVRMNRIVDKYNDWQENPNDNLASRMQLKFGSTPHGIGLSLVF